MTTGSYDLLVLNFQQRDVLLYNLVAMAAIAALLIAATELAPEHWPFVQSLRKSRTLNYALMIAMWLSMLVMNVLMMGAK
jgi:hypothetical protein